MGLEMQFINFYYVGLFESGGAREYASSRGKGLLKTNQISRADRCLQTNHVMVYNGLLRNARGRPNESSRIGTFAGTYCKGKHHKEIWLLHVDELSKQVYVAKRRSTHRADEHGLKACKLRSTKTPRCRVVVVRQGI